MSANQETMLATQVQVPASPSVQGDRQSLAWNQPRGTYVPAGMSPVRELLNLNHVIEDADSVLCPALRKKAALAYELAPDLPFVVGDYRQLRRLIVNLMAEAAEAIRAATAMVLLRTELIEADRRYLASTFSGQDMLEGEYALLQISRIACAVKEEDRERIFEPFITKHIGFEVVSALPIVRAHAGGIAVTSRPGSSALVRVALPAKLRKMRRPKSEVCCG